MMPHDAIVILFTAKKKTIGLHVVVVLFATEKRKEDDDDIIIILFAT
jgi:hypothetical protein